MFVNQKKANIQISSSHPLVQCIRHWELMGDKSNYKDNETG